MNKKKTILFIFGTRPETIKLAPVILAFKKKASLFKTIICTTAQHRQMLDQVLPLFNIIPDYDLNCMKSNQDLFDLSSTILNKVKFVLIKTKPDLVIVQGDTTTAYIAALAAFYHKIPVAHVEAGLRTNSKYQPFPEELNRKMVSILAEYHFAPTTTSQKNLLKENINKNKIWVTGNTVIDALNTIVKKQSSVKIQQTLNNFFFTKYGLSLPNTVKSNTIKTILVTCHRRENFGKGLENICNALKSIATINKNIQIVYPVHLNPNVLKPVTTILGKTPNIYLIKPLSYEQFVYIMSKSYLILTDSGGIQEEGPSLQKPVVVMRDTTERPEVINAGCAVLAGTDQSSIINIINQLLNDSRRYKKMVAAKNPYGNGKSSDEILKIISKLLS